jgi:maltodextrin utilization protein YvdJ
MGMPGGMELIFVFVFLTIFFVVPIVLHYRQERIILEHGTLRTIKEVPFLFSWTSAIFGFWVPLLRVDFKWFFIYLILGLLTYNIVAIILAFFYNKIYIKGLLEKGYKPADERSKALLIAKQIIKDDETN